MISINEIVKEQSPFLADSDEETINKAKKLVFYDYFVVQKQVAEDRLTDENSFTAQEKFFWADMTTYNLLKNKVLQNLAGKAGEAPETPKTVKKAKADVVEVEFESLDSKKALLLDTKKLVTDLEAKICQNADELNFRVSFCECETDVYPAFKVYC